MVVKELVALLGIKTDKKGFDQAESGMGKLIKIAKAAAAAFAGLKVVQFAKSVVAETAAAGDAIDKLSKRSGILAGSLQGWAHAAELSGATMQDVEMTIKRLQAAQVEAADGVATYADEFKRIGVEVKDSEGNFKDTTDLILEMSDAINGLDSQAEKTAVAMKLMGRSGTTLLPMLAEGSEGIREMIEELAALGGNMGDDLIKLGVDYVDNQQRMKVVMLGIEYVITKEILPAINDLTAKFIDFWKANGQIIQQHMATVFGGIGRVIMANVRFFGRLVKTVYNFVSNLSPLQKKMLGVGLAIKAIGMLISAGPIGKIILLIALIALIIEDFEMWRKGGKSVIGDLMNSLGELLGFSGDFEQWYADMSEGWGMIKSVAVGAITTITEFWANNFILLTDIIDSFVTFFTSVWDDPKAAFIQLFDDMSEAALGWYERFQELFGGVIEWFEFSVIAPIAGFFSGLWDEINEGIDKVLSPIKKLGSAVSSFFGIGEEESVADDQAALGDSPKNAGVRNLLGVAGSSGGLAGTKTINTKGGNSSVINAPKTTIHVAVKASPGMDGKSVGREVTRQIEKHTAKQNRAAMRVLTRSPSVVS